MYNTCLQTNILILRKKIVLIIYTIYSWTAKYDAQTDRFEKNFFVLSIELHHIKKTAFIKKKQISVQWIYNSYDCYYFYYFVVVVIVAVAVAVTYHYVFIYLLQLNSNVCFW